MVVMDRDPYFGSTGECRYHGHQCWLDLPPGKSRRLPWARGYGSGPGALFRQGYQLACSNRARLVGGRSCVWAALR